MAEMSYLWTTGGAGDGAATYTRVDWGNIVKILGACSGDEGVGGGALNEYNATTSDQHVTIDTGYALVDGKPHTCSAAADYTVISAVGVGNTRIDRIVLRASWAAQTVRLTVIAGVDAASPSAPAITQTPGTTYDILLWQALVDTSGVVTVTDERTWSASPPQVTFRQGGSATVWSTVGTTNYRPAEVIMQVGAVSWDNSIAGAVTFPRAFAYAPLVFTQHMYVADELDHEVVVLTVTTTGFTWGAIGAGDIYTLYWIAIGPE